jgi:hypothetical protein
VAVREQNRRDFRDHFARTSYEHGVSDTQVLSRYLRGVRERAITDHYTADRDGFK